ncbi:MAG: hypothetical protein LV479_02455 [Methylacidiphilales bacterium]|nr:hypothetical protein [Candidatus Methylacidiphilales bacterium]
MIPQQWKPGLALSLIFVVGMITGGALTLAFAPAFFLRPPPPGEAQIKNHLIGYLTRRLDLTPDQQAKIKPILADAARQMQGVHREEVGRISQILEKANAQIATILTPEQQARLQKLQKEMEKDRDRMFPGRMRSWGPPPHGGPDDMMRPPPEGGAVPPPSPPGETNSAPQNPPPQA